MLKFIDKFDDIYEERDKAPMAEFSPIIFRALGLPLPEKGEKLPFNYNAITKEADGITDSNRDGKVDEKDRNGWIEPEELYELVNSKPKYASVSKKILKINSENPLKITPEIKQHVENLKKLHNPENTLDTAILIFRSIILPDTSFKLLETCIKAICYFSNYKGLEENEGGLEIRYEKDRSKLMRREGDLRPEQILKAKVKSATCTELCYLLVVCLRAAGIESYIKVKNRYSRGKHGHVYVLAKIGWDWYELDPAGLFFRKTDKKGASDWIAMAIYYLIQGKAYHLNGQMEKAIKSYELALEFNPSFAAAWNNKGIIFKKQGKIKKAEECYKKALKLEPKYIIAWLNLGGLFKSQGRLEEAKNCFNEILRIRPDYALAWYKYGEILAEQGKLNEARKCFEEAFRLKPNLTKASREIAFLK